jgi:hypothetical protein
VVNPLLTSRTVDGVALVVDAFLLLLLVLLLLLLLLLSGVGIAGNIIASSIEGCRRKILLYLVTKNHCERIKHTTEAIKGNVTLAFLPTTIPLPRRICGFMSSAMKEKDVSVFLLSLVVWNNFSTVLLCMYNTSPRCVVSSYL